MKGYKGKVAFYKNTVSGTLMASAIRDENPAEFWSSVCPNYVFLGVTIDVDVEFPDSRQLEIEAIRKQMENERAESQQRLNVMMGRIQELQAISHD